jgi:hypothetical protein
VKLLIIAGPYESDRIRRAALSAGFEAVAVEPGESLSGWITATRPDVIILAPQIVNGEPIVALGKVRAVPRGRVPIFLVGDAEEREMLEPLADGFFVRPLAPEDLLARAREVHGGRSLGAMAASEEYGSGPHGTASSEAGGHSGRHAPPRPAPLQPLVAGAEGPRPRLPAPTSVRRAARVGMPEGTPSRTVPGPTRKSTMFDLLAENIEADFEAEIRDAVRVVGTMRPAPAAPRPVAGDPAATELTDESSQKTREVPHQVSNALAEGERSSLPAGADADEVELDLPSLLARMYLSRLSGRLTLRQGAGPAAVRKHIVFERGHPVLASSTRPEDRMGEMLIRHGRFSAEQIASCGAEVASSGRRMGAVLVERGLIKASELSLLVRRHYENIIYSLFSWERGAWNLGADNSAAAEKILLSQHPAALILEGIRRKYSAERALAGLGGAARILRLRLTSGASDLLEQMGIGSEERNLVLLFDGVRSLGEIRALTGAPPERLYGVAWALFVLDRLDAADAPTAEPWPSPDRGAGPAARVPVAAPPARLRDVAIDRALVMSRHALVVEGDYFQILGVSRDASAQEIRRAHEVLASELAPEALHPTVAAELAAQLEDIRAVLAEAARLMTNERVRRQYRDALLVGAAASTERPPA